MVKIELSGTRHHFTYISRVPCVGEAIVLPDNTTYTVTHVTHRALHGETDMAVAIVTLAPAHA